MKYLKEFNSIEEANTQGALGLDSPHVDIVDLQGGGGVVTNFIRVATDTFTCEFNESGKTENVVPKYEYEAVDLGLPSGRKWANMNLGASSPTDYGDYFMWGSTVPNTNDNCSWANAPFNNGSSTFDSAYFDSVKDTVCPNGILAPEYDAVHAIMGSEWRMPTKDEYDELVNNTNHEWVTDYQGSGINGRVFTSKTDSSKSIFIPASGNRSGSSVRYQGSYAYVWSSSLLADGAYRAWDLSFNSDICYTYSDSRYYGYCLRGVL